MNIASLRCSFFPKGLHVVLTNFGVSTVRNQNDPLLQDYPGSPAYIAPELMTGIPYTGYALDIWAIGVCLYILVTGDILFGLRFVN